MKKRMWIMLLIGLLLMGVSACATTETQKKAEGETDDWYTPYVEICAEEGILNTAEVKNFSPDDPLKLDELQVMLIRFYDLLHGGDGTIPPLPDDPLDYLQFLDEDGSPVAGIMDMATVYAMDGGIWVEFKTKPAQEELTLKMAFPGDEMYLCTHGNFVPGGIETEVEPYSAAGMFQMILPEESNVSIVVPDHYLFPVETEKSADVYASVLSAYSFMAENDWFDDNWDEWYYPSIYYWNYREGNYLTEPTPRERENPDLSPSEIAWREDLAIYLGVYCPEAVPRVDVTEKMVDARYTYSQNEIILGLCHAGVFPQDVESDNFDGQKPITKAETVAVIARVLRPELRKNG